MSSTVLCKALVCASLVLMSRGVLARESGATLSCETARSEQAAFKQAPGTARRVEKHVLEVTTKKGPRRFVDKPPYEEDDMGGLSWRYCGYNAQAKAHLIGMTDESVYSGKLVFDETGISLHAGHTVLFSPDKKEFLAIEQEDGMDGENWALYGMDGKARWKGYAGTTAKIDGIENVVSTFDRPQWTRQGALTARFVCIASEARRTVTLTHSPSNDLRWYGHKKCP